jgi:hypothetical protein
MYMMNLFIGRRTQARTKVHSLRQVNDERNLIAFDAVPFLPAQDNFHPKQNQAWQKRAMLATS